MAPNESLVVWVVMSDLCVPSADQVRLNVQEAGAVPTNEAERDNANCRTTRSASKYAKESSEEWQHSGHTWIRQRVLRLFRDQKVRGEVTSWLPASTEDPALFHVVHDDGEWLSQHMALMWWYALQEMRKTWMQMRSPLR